MHHLYFVHLTFFGGQNHLILLYCVAKQPASATPEPPESAMHTDHDRYSDDGSNDSTHDDGNQLSLELRVNFYLGTSYPTRIKACTALRYSSTMQESLTHQYGSGGSNVHFRCASFMKRPKEQFYDEFTCQSLPQSFHDLSEARKLRLVRAENWTRWCADSANCQMEARINRRKNKETGEVT
jgi:hypothetical protein